MRSKWITDRKVFRIAPGTKETLQNACCYISIRAADTQVGCLWPIKDASLLSPELLIFKKSWTSGL